jgi:integrase
MGKLYVYARGSRPTWYIGGFPTGKKQRSTGLAGPDARKLADRLCANEQKMLDALVAKHGPIGPMTVARWHRPWVDGLRADGRPAADKYDGLISQHVLPVIGNVPLADLTVEHIFAVLRHTQGTRAQRTRLQIFTVMKMMFRAAIPRHLASNPCLEVERGHALMPKNVDHDPLFRKLARFTIEEVSILLFDERVPEDRRFFYAIAFCTGMRSGEISALTFEMYDPTTTPLGELTVARSYKAEKKTIKGTKTGGIRLVPVIPLLAELWAEWAAPGGGWSRLTGKESPAAGDLVVPTGPLGKNPHRNTHTTLELFHDDLRRLGLRERSIHFSRHTFIRLCKAEGATKEILKWVTHGRPKEDAFDEYSEPPWRQMCQHASLFPLVRPAREAEAVPLRKYAISGGEHLQGTDSGTDVSNTSGESWSAARFARSAASRGPDGTVGDPEGNPGDFEAPSTPASAQEATDGPHVCRSVSAVSAARRALERGAVDEALAILRGASR